MPKDTNKVVRKSLENNDQETLVYNQAWRKNKIQYPSNDELQKIFQVPYNGEYPEYEFQEGYIN